MNTDPSTAAQAKTETARSMVVIGIQAVARLLFVWHAMTRPLACIRACPPAGRQSTQAIQGADSARYRDHLEQNDYDPPKLIVVLPTMMWLVLYSSRDSFHFFLGIMGTETRTVDVDVAENENSTSICVPVPLGFESRNGDKLVVRTTTTNNDDDGCRKHPLGS